MRKIIHNKLSKFVLAAGALLLVGLFTHTPPASANSIGYNPAELISDTVMSNSSSMSAGDIQNFFKSLNSGLANKSFKATCSGAVNYMKKFYNCGHTESAAQIIHDASQAYSINPQVILATLQKEQSLVTMKDPPDSVLKVAMSYMCPDDGGCQGYYGFFNQVDWATWQLRANMEYMNGRSYIGYGPNYLCSGDTRFYFTRGSDTGLFPGHTVTFKDGNGVQYRTLDLANSATASLYCYTPHTYNNPNGLYSMPKWGSKGAYYSGSYWFEYWFGKWFGSTVYRWSGQVVEEHIYKDAARTQELTSTINTDSGDTLYVTVKVKNTGYKTWQDDFVKVATTDPSNRSSAFRDDSWLNSNRAARLQESSVTPNQIGTFEFSLTSPLKNGEYLEHFILVAEGKDQGWMRGTNFSFDINVDNPFNGKVTSLKAYSNSSRTKRLDANVMTEGQTVYFTLKVKNTGSETWQQGFTHLGTVDPNNHSSNFHNSSWMSSNRLTRLEESSVAPGKTGTFKFSLTAPGSPGDYSDSFGLVADGQDDGWMPSAKISRSFKVVKPPLDTLYNGRRLYRDQEITSKNNEFRLILQSDSNLVLYHNGKPLWASNTRGKHAADLVMQGDGNLVLYNNHGKPLWTSKTAGKGGSRLLIQNDGNLVIYHNGHATWASGTVTKISQPKSDPPKSDPPSSPNKSDHLSNGQELKSGQEIMSSNNNYRLVMQGDGNLVVYYHSHAIWASDTAHTSANRVVMQGDGNLVIYGDSKAYWSSRTAGKGGSRLLMQNDGNLVVYHNGHATWASDTVHKT